MARLSAAIHCKLRGMSDQSSGLSELQKHAARIRQELQVPRQNEVFRAAVEAGYLVAIADGEFDDDERATLVKAVEALSVDAVIEWETEALLDECAARVEAQGAGARAEAVGRELKSLGAAEAGLLLASAVALATKKVDKKEAAALAAVGSAAGLREDEVKAIVKKARG
jgi:tellurite resistance protein